MKVIKTISLSLLVCSSLSFGWEINTHRAIDRCALVEDSVCGRGEVAKNLHWFAENSIPKEKGAFESYVNENLEGYTVSGKDTTYFNYILNGEKDGISKWNQDFQEYDYVNMIEAGTILEDTLYPDADIIAMGGDGRFNNHFYDPQNGGKGLTIGYGDRVDAITWAEMGADLGSYFDKRSNEYSYEKALEYFRKGFIEKNPNERKRYRAKMFASIGYLLHMLNDMNVPAHTRDDSHPNGDPLEIWMRGGEEGRDAGGFKIIKTQLSNPNPTILSVVKTVDPLKYSSFRDFYEQQANFTGDNFYSEDSISVNGGTFGGYSDYHPMESEVNVYTGDGTGFITSNSTDLGNAPKLAMMQKSKIPFKDYWYGMEIDGDKSVLIDNGVNLIPKAVANAEGFLNYFFRGRLKATLKDGNLTIENVSDPSLVASEDIVRFHNGGFTLYYETDNNETKLFGTQSFFVKDFKVGDKLSYDISAALANTQDIGSANKITVLYQGDIGIEEGISVAIAKKITNVDLLFSFDKSGSMGSSIEDAKNSAKDILDNIVGVENNSTFIEVEAFNSSAGVLLAYENNVTEAKNAISTIYSGGGTALYDAIKLAGDNAVTHKASSGIFKSIVILYTDGQENSSSASREEAIDAISNAKASSIDEVFLIFVGSDSEGEAKLKAIADEAGRKFMSVSDASGLKDAIEQILTGQ